MTAAPPTPRKPRVCLSMVVNNHASVVARCLESARPIVDAWAILDTGSTDGTQDLVRSILDGLPGSLHERPSQGLAQDKTEAIGLARDHATGDDYVLVLDATDALAVAPDFQMPALTRDVYEVVVEEGGSSYARVQLFRAGIDVRYVGAHHEVLLAPSVGAPGRLTGVTCLRSGGAALPDRARKSRDEASVLEAALAVEPTNTQYAIHLAQTLSESGEIDRARHAYERRAGMGGSEEEIYFSLHEIARLTALLGRPLGEVMDAYLRAYERRTSRAEALCNLASYLRQAGRAAAAYPFARLANETPRPGDVLFVDESVYLWRALDEYAIAAYWAGRFAEALAGHQRLLASGSLPPRERERIERNMGFCKEKVAGHGRG